MARLCVDSDDFQISDTGELQLKPGSLGVQQMLVFTANGTFNKADYPKLSRVWVRAVGGGGGSAATPATTIYAAQSGGGGGGYAESIIQAAALPASVPITVGAGGTAGVVPTGAGGDGGTSSFGSLVVAGGGQGSQSQMGDFGTAPSAGTPFNAGQGTTGQILAAGERSQISVRLANTFGYPGAGGSSVLGGGGGWSGAQITPGGSGGNYGGGASGSSNLSNAAQAGGPGAQGIVIVTLIF